MPNDETKNNGLKLNSNLQNSFGDAKSQNDTISKAIEVLSSIIKKPYLLNHSIAKFKWKWNHFSLFTDSEWHPINCETVPGIGRSATRLGTNAATWLQCKYWLKFVNQNKKIVRLKIVSSGIWIPFHYATQKKSFHNQMYLHWIA